MSIQLQSVEHTKFGFCKHSSRIHVFTERFTMFEVPKAESASVIVCGGVSEHSAIGADLQFSKTLV